MDSETLTIVLFIINALVGLVLVIGGFAVTRVIKENEKNWDAQNAYNEKREIQIQDLKISHEKNRKDIEVLEQRERLIETQNAEKFTDVKEELKSIKDLVTKIDQKIK